MIDISFPTHESHEDIFHSREEWLTCRRCHGQKEALYVEGGLGTRFDLFQPRRVDESLLGELLPPRQSAAPLCEGCEPLEAHEADVTILQRGPQGIGLPVPVTVELHIFARSLLLDGDWCARRRRAGRFLVKLPVKVVDPKTKAEQTLELDAIEAIGKMRENPANGNLFLFDGKTGLGGTNHPNNPATEGQPDFAKMSPAQYQEWRKKNFKK